MRRALDMLLPKWQYSENPFSAGASLKAAGQLQSITVPGGARHKNKIMGRLLQASDLMEASTAHGQHDV